MMASKCKDCGERDYVPSSRSDVCVDCMNLRRELIKALDAGTVSHEQFTSIQRTMNTDIFRHGRAAKKMRKALASDPQKGE